MKRCVNRNCDSNFLYGNDKTECPFCHQPLQYNSHGTTDISREIVALDEVLMFRDEENIENPVFIRHIFNGIECHGRLVEIDHHEVFNGKWHKLFNALIRNEPYQLAHQTAEYTIRVENISDEYPTDIMDFCMYGNYLGRLQVGDEVVIKAKDYSDRRVVREIYNSTTASIVRPGFQIPAGLIKVCVLGVLAIIVALMCTIVWLFKSGVIVTCITIVGVAIFPIIIFAVGVWLLFRSVFPRRRRRRFWDTGGLRIWTI